MLPLKCFNKINYEKLINRASALCGQRCKKARVHHPRSHFSVNRIITINVLCLVIVYQRDCDAMEIKTVDRMTIATKCTVSRKWVNGFQFMSLIYFNYKKNKFEVFHAASFNELVNIVCEKLLEEKKLSSDYAQFPLFS